MNEIERETVIDSLTHLENYYQSRYEHYLAMATEAKEHRERIKLLLQDLLSSPTHLQNYIVESRSLKGEENNLLIERRSRNNGQINPGFLPSESKLSKLELASITDNVDVDVDVEDSSASNQIEQMRRFLQTLSKAMSVIELVVNSDSGKTLHRNYLQTLLERELEQKLSFELIELYLDEAIKRSYLKRDEYDRNCYLVVNTQTDDSLSSQDKSAIGATVDRDKERLKSPDLSSTENAHQAKKTRATSSTPAKKLNHLPHSSRLRRTLVQTVKEYIAHSSPKTFSAQDVTNYLYTKKQQLNWSKTKKNKVYQAIANVLSRSSYVGTEWKRVQPGVYQPL
ncbi:MAG: hypothetical protein QNJ53_08075 [Pleurocapsa sp. MO_192.B19]|nr:hypothetical protein [Pleurocapsa sp. MO_192.B19]